MRLLLVGLALWFSSAQAYAQQLNFDRHKVGFETDFAYRWKDMAGKVQTLDFRLVNRLAQADFDFRPYDNKAANDYVFERLQAYASQPHNGVQLTIKRTDEGFTYTAAGPQNVDLAAQLAQVRQATEQFYKEYVYSRYYTYAAENVLMPDHQRIAGVFYSAMRPLALAIQRQAGNDQRTTINYALNFLQNIPYDTLLSRETSYGAGYATPIEMLNRNRGDCDTKTVVLATILRNLYPNLAMVIVYVPGHAFMGLEIPMEKNDFALQIGHRRFVLAEPVGPRLMAVGQIDERSQAKLLEHAYSYSEFPRL